MKRIGLLATMAAVLAFGLLPAGCSSDSPSATGDGITSDLNLPFGGYTVDDEAPAFGDVDMAGLLDEGEAVADPLLSEDDLDSLEKRPGANVYKLAVRWGMLEGDSTVTTATDWSGEVSVSRGAVAVGRLIRFEREQDYIVRPRENRHELEWVSMTTVHYDGLVLTIIDPPVHPDLISLDNLLTITAGSYTRTFNLTMGDLDELDEIVDVDLAGNQIAFNARKLSFRPCGGGHLNGFWQLDSTHTAGRLFGSWVSEDGRLLGHLRGHFGTSDDGKQKFFGKLIGLNGEFRGRMHGRWGFADDSDERGWFRGEWAGPDGRPFGLLRGRWSNRPPDGDRPGHLYPDEIAHPHNGSGFFGGGWKKVCLEPGDPPGDGV